MYSTLETFTVPVLDLQQWFFWGYAIAFSPSKSGYWGGTTGLVFRQVNTRPTGNDHGPQIPELLYALFHGMFACFT
jgi:Amt family ammonium transporter